MNTIQGHSEEFIEEMKQLLLNERAQLQKELGTIGHAEHGDIQANFPDYGRSDEENADEVADFQARHAATEASEGRLKEVLAALERIEEGNYGVTADGVLIPEARLRANPAASTTIEPKS